MAIKKRPIMRQCADVLNCYDTNQRFTHREFVDLYNNMTGENLNHGSAYVFLGKAFKNEFILKEDNLSTTMDKVYYIKILDIPEESMTLLTTTTKKRPKKVDVNSRKTIPSPPPPITADSPDSFDNTLVNMSSNLIKGMENLIKKQHDKISELKSEIAELFDENQTMSTQIKILNGRLESRPLDYHIDLSQYEENIQ